MKFLSALVCLIFVIGCGPMPNTASQADSPCQDSRYLELKQKFSHTLTAKEATYLKQKAKECEEWTEKMEEEQSSTRLTWAILGIVSLAATVGILVLVSTLVKS